MLNAKSPESASLLDILVDGFEKNEVMGGFHWRELPMPEVSAAVRKVGSLIEEARRWLGEPEVQENSGGRRRAAWPALEIRQAGRGIMILVPAPNFDHWWHRKDTWQGDPMGEVRLWLHEPSLKPL